MLRLRHSNSSHPRLAALRVQLALGFLVERPKQGAHSELHFHRFSEFGCAKRRQPKTKHSQMQSKASLEFQLLEHSRQSQALLAVDEVRTALGPRIERTMTKTVHREERRSLSQGWKAHVWKKRRSSLVLVSGLVHPIQDERYCSGR